MKNKKYLYLLLLIIPIIVFFIGNAYSQEVEVKSVEIQSDDYPEPGSFHITKSAEWTKFSKAKVTFDIDTVKRAVDNKNKDVILVMDISGSMRGEKLNRAKSDAIELTNYLLDNPQNSMALIVFDTGSEIETGFINDKNEMLNLLNNIIDKGCTNYNSALQNIDVVMNNYVQKENTDLITLFLTDGFPNEDTPNQVATYYLLKDKYNYMTINGIQYEMGLDIIQEIIDITDNQWIADMNTLHNVLFDAVLDLSIYEQFIITDYINDDYFDINLYDDIEVSIGHASIVTENGFKKIEWNLGTKFKTGDSAKMTINLSLKEAYNETKGYYPTNKGETIKSKFENEEEKIITSELTPVLKNAFNVSYDVNTPTGCNLPSIEQEEHYVYQQVNINKGDLSCTGYVFKGWVIDDTDKEDMIIINSDNILMPAHDVTIRGIWTKEDLSKKMDGTVHEKTTLYKVFKNYYEAGTYAKKYEGEHQDSFNGNGDKDIFYWDGSNYTRANEIYNKNNVIFGEHCWKMMRTTDTGGVKLLYNGEAENDKCLSTRGNHAGYGGSSNPTTALLRGTYIFSDHYELDKSTGYFKLTGEMETIEITDDNQSTIIPTLKGKYTCKTRTSEETCYYLYLIHSYKQPRYSGADNSFILWINTRSSYDTFGTFAYDSAIEHYTPGSISYYTTLSNVGYMHNATYMNETSSYIMSERMLEYFSLNTSYKFAENVEWGSQSYKLINPYNISSSSDYPSLKNKYTVEYGGYTSGSKARYITYVSNYGYAYYITLSDGHDLSYYNDTYTYGDSFIANNDGTYTIKNDDGSPPKTIAKIDWYSNYNDVGTNKYVCKNAVNNTCSELWLTTYVSSTSMSIMSSNNNYKYANGFNYVCENNQNCKYVLNDDSVFIWNMKNNDNLTSINSHHYTCFNDTGECDSVYYILRNNGSGFEYFTLENGKSIEDIVNESLYLDNDNYHVNQIDSQIKTGVDGWYKNFLYDRYDQYIEDVIYCNDRTIIDAAGLNPNGGNINKYVTFKGYNPTGDLSCAHETDRFSTLNNKAKLTYKVGLATIEEMRVSYYGYDYGSIYMYGNSDYWLASPYNYQQRSAHVDYMRGSSLTETYTSMYYGVKPVISLKPGIEYVGGDGSMERPYLIDDGTN